MVSKLLAWSSLAATLIFAGTALTALLLGWKSQGAWYGAIGLLATAIGLAVMLLIVSAFQPRS
jgi:hypothetical protein